jgi:hypothetical protein
MSSGPAKKIKFKCVRCEFPLARMKSDLGKSCPKCFFDKPYVPKSGGAAGSKPVSIVAFATRIRVFICALLSLYGAYLAASAVRACATRLRRRKRRPPPALPDDRPNRVTNQSSPSRVRTPTSFTSQAAKKKKSSGGSIFDRLTDTSLYTGAHKHRFNKDGYVAPRAPVSPPTISNDIWSRRALTARRLLSSPSPSSPVPHKPNNASNATAH